MSLTGKTPLKTTVAVNDGLTPENPGNAAVHNQTRDRLNEVDTLVGDVAGQITDLAVELADLGDISGLADVAQAAAVSAKADADRAKDISNISTSDGVVTALANDPNSNFAKAQAAVVVPVGQGASRLSSWRRKLRNDAATAKMLWFGDSTSNWATGPSSATPARLAGIQYQGETIPPLFHTNPGQGLAGMTADADHFIDGGSSGITAEAILAAYDAGSTAAKSLRWAIAQAPDLFVLSIGINGVRDGQTTKVQLVAQIRRIVNIVRAALPGTDLLLRMPNSLSTTDYQGLGYVRTAPAPGGVVNPDGLAQTYSTLLREAYLSLSDAWPNVVVADTQAAVFGTKSIARAASGAGFMGDQLHPSSGGQRAMVDYLVRDFLGAYPRAAVTSDLPKSAVAVDPYTPQTVDPTVLDDKSRYTRIMAGDGSVDSIAGTRQSLTWPTAGDGAPFDVLRAPDGTTYVVPSNATFTQNGATTRISSSLAVAHQPGLWELFRQTGFTGDATMDRAVFDRSKRFRRFFRVVSATTTAVTLRPVSVTGERENTPAAELAALIQAGNSLYLAGNGAAPVALSGGQWSASGANIVVSGLATDYTTYVGRLAAVIGTQADAAAGGSGAVGPAGKTGNATVSGRDLLPVLYGPPSSQAGTNGTEYAVPFVFNETVSITTVSLEVAAAVSGAVARLGLRSSTGNLPDALIGDYGTVDCSATGLKSITLPAPVEIAAGTLVWAIVREAGTAAPNLKTATGVSPYVSFRGGVAGEIGASSYGVLRSTTDAALVANFGAGPTPSNHAPLVRLRAA